MKKKTQDKVTTKNDQQRWSKHRVPAVTRLTPSPFHLFQTYKRLITSGILHRGNWSFLCQVSIIEFLFRLALMLVTVSSMELKMYRMDIPAPSHSMICVKERGRTLTHEGVSLLNQYRLIPWPQKKLTIDHKMMCWLVSIAVNIRL